MADFNPKFVDLVRNYTTTTGTGDFVLSSAVNGFTGFASALQPGDRFYYSCIGVDKPAEREVGRGTLTADGKIVREPIGAAKSNFSSGTKAIALVTAAEWYSSVGSSSAAAATALQGAATRTALAAAATAVPTFLKEARREGLFTFDPGDLQARFGASLAVVDPNQALFVAPPADPTGAAGAWVRQYDGIVRPEWWGARGDDKTDAGNDDGPAFAAMLATLAYVSDGQSETYYAGAPTIELGAKCYYLGSTTLDFTFTAIMRGAGTGLDGGVATRLRWAAGATGIRVQRYNTSGASGYDSTPIHKAGDGCVFRGLCLKGNYTDTEGEFHGFHLRARAKIEDCYIYGFQGDGIRIWASQGSGGSSEGNANQVQLSNVAMTFNRNGVYADGSDCNAGCWIGLNLQYNREWGIFDSSFLGNYVFGCHFDGNGVDKTFCHLSGERYQVIPGQEAGASTNAPSATATDNTWWRYISDGGSGTGFTAWTSGLTWRSGGHYFTDSTSGSLSHSYLESGYGFSYSIGLNSSVWGCFGGGDGIIGSSFSASQIYGFYTPNGLGTKGLLISETLAQLKGSGAILPNSAKLEFTAGTFTSQARANPSTGDFDLYNYDSGAANYAGGRFMFNSLDVVCDINGMKIANFSNAGLQIHAGKIGYGAGAGGTVTQATSRTTGVTLNKAAGAITLFSATTIAGQVTSFIVTNSLVAAGDTVNLSVKSGSGTYLAFVTQVAAGSFAISVHTPAAVSTAEAPVINFALVKAVAA